MNKQQFHEDRDDSDWFLDVIYAVTVAVFCISLFVSELRDVLTSLAVGHWWAAGIAAAAMPFPFFIAFWLKRRGVFAPLGWRK